MSPQSLYAMIRDLERDVKDQLKLDRSYYANIEARLTMLEDRIKALEPKNEAEEEWGK